jgi:protein-tyrosine phosphatase
MPTSCMTSSCPRRDVTRSLKALGRRLLERLETWRAERVRRKPERLIRGLRAARSVLIVCQGNVIRSAVAAPLLSAALGDRTAVVIRSAGLETVPGWPAHPYIRRRCADLGVDLTAHASAAISKPMVDAADVVLVMEVSQIIAFRRRFPGAHRKTFLLSALARDVSLEIRDPNGQDDAAFDACFEHITRALRPLSSAMRMP